MTLYQITSTGNMYIHLADLYNMANDQNIPIIGTADFILECFNENHFEINGVCYTADELDTPTKIQIFIEDGFVKQLTSY